MINSDSSCQSVYYDASHGKTGNRLTGYEGFYHLIGIQGDVEQSTVSYIIRDHDRAKFENRKKEIKRLVAQINAEYGAGTATLELRDQYYNMREKIEPVMHIIDTAFAAMEAVETECKTDSWRYGWSALSFKGSVFSLEYFCRWSEFPRSLRICAYPEYGESNERHCEDCRTSSF